MRTGLRAEGSSGMQGVQVVQSTIQSGIRTFRRVVVAVVGGTIVLIGLALLVLPGPAFVVLPVGLAILGIEFAWARRWLTRVREQVRAVAGSGRRQPEERPDCERPSRDPGSG